MSICVLRKSLHGRGAQGDPVTPAVGRSGSSQVQPCLLPLEQDQAWRSHWSPLSGVSAGQRGFPLLLDTPPHKHHLNSSFQLLVSNYRQNSSSPFWQTAVGYRVSWQILQPWVRVYQTTYLEVRGSITLLAKIQKLGQVRGVGIILGDAFVQWGKGSREWAQRLYLTLNKKNSRVKYRVNQHFSKLQSIYRGKKAEQAETGHRGSITASQLDLVLNHAHFFN